MQLPQEVRDNIYAHLFFSTRFASGDRAFGRIDHRRVVSATGGKALNILRSCQRVHDEIGDSWLAQVPFHFERPEAMLNKLANIPVAVRSQVRHVRVSGDPLMISFGYDEVYYRTAQALKLLPGLHLDVLTVLANRGAEVSYETLNMLIRHADGWRELRYISHSSKFLGFAEEVSFGPSDSFADRYLRQPQPSDWQQALEQRDGAASSPSVTIYRANGVDLDKGRLTVFQPNSRVVLRQSFAAGQNARTYGKVEDTALMQPKEREKEVFVVVKRGSGVDSAEKEGSPYLPVGDIREDRRGMTWKEIKAEDDAKFRDVDGYSSSDDDSSEGGIIPFKYDGTSFVDSYSHMDEYTWPPLHSSGE